MNTALEAAARELIQRAAMVGTAGAVADAAELQRVNHALSGQLPAWYAELISTFPLCGLELGWRDEDDVSWIVWSTPEETRSEAQEAYPGIAILERGYINVAGCDHGSGDQYFIPTDQGDNPPLFQVYHDISDQADEILAKGLLLVAPSLSEFFSTAIVEQP